MEKKHLFSNADLRKLLLPLMVEQVLNSLMGTADTVMVSNVGSAAMSAVSLVDSINILVIQAFSALATGGAIVCAQYMGRKDEKGANKSARQVLLSITAVSVIITLLCMLCRDPLLKAVFGSVEKDVMTASRTYFFITALSFPFIAIYNSGAAIYRAQGNSRRPMLISVVCNCINIGGNALLIWGFHMGVAGVAIATLVSRICCAAAVMYYLHKPGQAIVIRDYGKIRPDMGMIGRVLSIGIPSGIENGMFQFGKLAIQSTVSTLGTVAIAAQAMTNVMEGLNGMAVVGVGIGLMTVVGQCIGAGRKEEAVYYIKKLTVIGEVVMIASCLLVFILAKPITILGGMEPESARMCLYMIGWITLIKPIAWILSFIPAYGMRAAGDVKFSMIVSTITMWICRVSLSVFLCRRMGFGPIAVWIGMFADWTARSVIFAWRFYSRKWLNHKVIQ